MTSFYLSLRRKFWPAFLIIIFGASAAMAGVPGKPLEFAASMISNSPPTVKLTWKANNDGYEALGYRVYAAEGQTEDLSKFRIILETKEKNATFSDRRGIWTFFVRAYNSDGESERTPIKVVNFEKEQPRMKFLTSPKTTAGINQVYVYEAQAQYGDSHENIRYKIITGPDSISIGGETGRLVWWTAGSPGKYLVVIRAYLESNPDIYVDQEWKIIIGEEDALRFTTTPPREGKIGEKWVYEARAKYFTEPNSIINYSIVEGPDGMEIDTRTGRITWTPQRDGIFTVVIRARVDGKPDMKVDQKFEIIIGNAAGIRFATQPNSKTCIDKEYVYMPIVVNANKETIKENIVFSLLQPPHGMTINEKTGSIRWTPSTEGKYYVILMAVVTSKGTSATIKQQWIVDVQSAGCEDRPRTCAVIMGKISDKDGNLIQRGWAAAVRTDKGDGLYKGEINNGKYAIHVSEGTFAVNVGGEDIVPQWYQDAETIKNAMRIPVKCYDTIVADITVQRHEPPKVYTVSGKVTNVGGQGIPAMVSFIVREKNGVYNKEKSMQFMAQTDREGAYSIKLPGNFVYVASAASVSDKYIRIFFDNTPNPQEAALIKLEANREINFVLPERPTFNNGFSGRLTNQDGGVVIGKAIAIRIAQPGVSYRSEYLSAATETDNDGNFILTNLLPGKYVLLGVPATRDWAPGFYREHALAVMNWKEASKIEVGETMLSQTFIVQLHKVGGKRGAGRIHGIVRSGKGAIKGDNAQGAEPLAGALIVAYDENELISDYAFSADDGSYDLVETGAGTFTVALGKPNYEGATFTTAIDYSLNPVSDGNDMTLTPASPAGVYENAAMFGAVIYPNPASGVAALRFDGMAGNCTISIVNAVGAILQSFAVPTVAGENNFALDLGNIESGVYFVRVSNGTTVFAMPITIAR